MVVVIQWIESEGPSEIQIMQIQYECKNVAAFKYVKVLVLE